MRAQLLSAQPVVPRLFLRDTAADTLSTFGDIFIDPSNDRWLNGPPVFITEEEANICTNEGLWKERIGVQTQHSWGELRKRENG